MILVARPDDIEEDIFQRSIFVIAAGALTELLDGSLRHQNSLIDDTDTRSQVLHDLRA